MPPLIVTSANANQMVAEARRRAGLQPHERYRGCLQRTTRYAHQPGAFLPRAAFPRIPRSKWKDLIRAGRGTWLGDLTRPVLPPHDQGATLYCWAHGSVRAVEALRVYEGQAPLILSAESVAVPITGGRNRGGTPDEALLRLRTHGACAQSYWPQNDRDISHAKIGWQHNAMGHAILSWADIENWDDQITMALHRIPVAIGLGWWGHLVCQLDPVILPDGSVGIAADNSWGDDWGDHGRFLLDEEHGTADFGAFAALSETFAETQNPEH